MKRNGAGPGVHLSSGSESLTSSSGSVLLLRTAAVTGLARSLSAALAPWRADRAVHDPGKTLLDLAVAVALASIFRPGGA